MSGSKCRHVHAQQNTLILDFPFFDFSQLVFYSHMYILYRFRQDKSKPSSSCVFALPREGILYDSDVTWYKARVKANTRAGSS